MDTDARFEVTNLGKILTAGTTAQIVEAYVSQTQDVEQINYLILAHEQFTTSLNFWKEFINCFKSSSSDQLKQFRIVNILKKWIELMYDYDDGDSELGREMESFREYLQKHQPQLASFVKTSEPTREHEEEPVILTPPPIIWLKKKRKKKGPDSLLYYDSEEIARQLTLIDHNMLSKIDRKEMIRTRWTNVLESPTLQESGERANRIAFWFAYLLVQEKKLKTRSKMLEHFIKIAMYLSKLHNYQSLMAIFLALNMISGRLAQTWRTLRPKTLSTWKRISTLMSPNDNFSHYREALKTVELPFIPCQEVILKDLLYHDGSIPDFVEEGVWNFKKLQVIGKILDQFRQCQEAHYNYTVLNELQNLLLNVPVITSTHLDSVPEEIDSTWPNISVKVNRIVPVYRAEKTEATTESETDDADSSVGNATTAPTTTLARSTSTRTRARSGSVGEEVYETNQVHVKYQS